MTLRFGDVRLLAEDYRSLFRFYRHTLDLPLDWGDEETGYAQFKCGALTLALFERKAMAEVLSTNLLPVSAACQDRFVLSFAVDDVDAAAGRLLEKGAVQVTNPHNREDWGYRVAHFRDPDGNVIELYRPIQGS